MRVVVVAVTLLLLLLTTIILAVSQGFFTRGFGKLKLDVAIPSSLNERTLWGPKLNHERLLLQMELKLQNTSQDKEGKSADPFINERWMSLSSALFYRTDTIEVHAETHALLLLYAAESGDRSLFDSINQTIEDYFLLTDGLLRGARIESAANPEFALGEGRRPEASESQEQSLLNDRTVWKLEREEERHDYYSSLIYMRSLALAYQQWGDRAYSDALSRSAEAYLALSVNDLPPVHPSKVVVSPTPPTFVNEEGADNAELEPGESTELNEMKELGLIRFSDIDLYSLYVLQQVDPAFSSVYENTLNIIIAAKREQFAVYAEAYDPVEEVYVQYFSDPYVHLDEQLKIMIGLAEVNQLNEAASAWLRSRINNYQLVETYSLHDVTSIGSPALPLRYGQISRLARLLEDTALYQAALDRLLETMISTVSQSPIYGLVFRIPLGSEEAQVTSADNAWALLGTK